MSTPTLCARCGRPLVDLAILAAKAARARRLIRGRHLAVPDVALADLDEIASQLRCRTDLCGGTER